MGTFNADSACNRCRCCHDCATECQEPQCVPSYQPSEELVGEEYGPHLPGKLVIDPNCYVCKGTGDSGLKHQNVCLCVRCDKHPGAGVRGPYFNDVQAVYGQWTRLCRVCGAMRSEPWAPNARALAPTSLTQLIQNPRSQKAQGLRALSLAANGMSMSFTDLCGERLQGVSLPGPTTMLVQSDEAFEKLRYWQRLYALPKEGRNLPSLSDLATGQLFARPCPTRPRHGFIESRIVTSIDEIQTLWLEARKADPDAELLLMDPIDATHSGILIAESGMLALGPGNDGATAGRDSLMLPVPVYKLGAQFRRNAQIAANEHTYVEFVGEVGADSGIYSPLLYLVQARSGPPLADAAVDYVPHEVKVCEVIEPTDDLLAWERLTTELSQKPGVVAYQSGATLACHAAVHCVANKIPFVTSRSPEIGEVLTPPKGVTNYPFDLADFKQGVALAQAASLTELRSGGIQVAVALIHGISRLQQWSRWSLLAGYSIAMICRAAALACLGELRHYWSLKYDKYGDMATPIAREGLWEEMDQPLLYANVRRLGLQMHLFAHGGRWKQFFCTDPTGYGGVNWFACALETVRLYQAIIRTAETGDGAYALKQCNQVIHVAHNGGSLLNKFVNAQMLDSTAQGASGVHLAVHGKFLLDLIKRIDQSAKAWIPVPWKPVAARFVPMRRASQFNITARRVIASLRRCYEWSFRKESGTSAPKYEESEFLTWVAQFTKNYVRFAMRNVNTLDIKHRSLTNAKHAKTYGNFTWWMFDGSPAMKLLRAYREEI